MKKQKKNLVPLKKFNPPYKNFNTYCLRTPLFQLDYFFELTKKKSKEEILKYFDNPISMEAIFMASFDLYKEFKKWQEGGLDTSKTKKLSISLLKYASRMSSRCTPFGIFAGCNAGVFTDSISSIIPKTIDAHKRHTRLDMHYLVNITQEFSKNEILKKELNWYPNTSLYEVGNQYRYIEYAYCNKVRNYSIEAVAKSVYIEAILVEAKSGKTIQELTKILVDDEITLEEATNFIETLIDNQLLISELEPSMTGGDYLPVMLTTLQRIKAPELLVNQASKISTQLDNLDKKIGNSIATYVDILNTIEALGVKSDRKFLFQTDLFLKTQKNQLNRQLVSDLKKGMTLLNKITVPNKKKHLEKFKEAFIDRYEGKEVPLTEVLDNEMGISYVQGLQHSASDPLIDDLLLPEVNEDKNKSLTWNPLLEVLHKKLQDISIGQTLELQDSDFKDFEENWDDLPNTMSSLIELINLKGKQKVVVTSFGGSSAGNLLGRFCYGDQKLNDLVTEITKKEKELAPEAIHSEIVHLPESRTGNILRRPILRDYEIPYLGASKLPVDQQLLITDLLLSVRRNKLYLRSKKHNKQVIPHLTNAHKFSANALPVYHFLCDMQTQNLRKNIYFNWGILAGQYSYLPRVTYQNLIFSKAQWIFTKEEWSKFNDVINQPELLLQKIKAWRIKHGLPQYIQLVEGDNTLLVNLKNITSFQMLLQSLKNKPQVILEEFLFTEDTVVKNESGSFTNQIVVAFYKDKNDYIEY